MLCYVIHNILILTLIWKVWIKPQERSSKRLKISTDISNALESKMVSKVRLVELLPKARILLLMKLTRNQKFEPAKNTVENVVQIGPKKRPT